MFGHNNVNGARWINADLTAVFVEVVTYSIHNITINQYHYSPFYNVLCEHSSIHRTDDYVKLCYSSGLFGVAT